MGARIEGAGTSTHPHRMASRSCTEREHTIIPDRIEAGTFLIAAAMAGGDVIVRDCEKDHLLALIAKLRAVRRRRDRGQGRARCACAPAAA